MNAVVVPYIEFETHGAASQLLDFVLEIGQRSLIPAGDDKIGARAGEGASKVLSEAPVRAGNNGHPSRKVEEFAHYEGLHQCC